MSGTALRRLWIALLAFGLVCAFAVHPNQVSAHLVTQQAAGRANAPDPALMIVLDTSGSMDERGGSAITRLDQAKASIIEVLTTIDSETMVGLVNYPGSRAIGGCPGPDSQIALAPLRLGTAVTAVRALRADGNTPTSTALREAAVKMKAAGLRSGTILLVSDGESNCGDPPCEVAKSLTAEGFDVTVNTVGLSLEESGKRELQCVADATGGKYYDADQVADIDQALADASRPRLGVGHTIPAQVPVAVGDSSKDRASSTEVTVTVHNAAAVEARDVRVIFGMAGQAGPPGSTGQTNTVVSPPVRYLGNLAPGERRVVSFSMRPRATGVDRWTLRAIASNAKPVLLQGEVTIVDGLATDSLGPLLRGADNVMVVGDSYSSGEGAGVYKPGTFGALPNNRCHRSDHTYAQNLVGPSGTAHIVACSGAVIGDLTSPQISHEQRVPAQLLAIHALAMQEKSLDAVFMTLGGNDIGFGDLVTTCAGGSVIDCDEPLTGLDVPEGSSTKVNETDELGPGERIEATGKRLPNAYRVIDRAVNNPAAVNLRGGKVIPIIVLPYVRVTPESPVDEKSHHCVLGVRPRELAFLNTISDELNYKVSAATKLLQNEGRPFYYVDEVIPAFQPAHTLCDGTNAYVNTFVEDASNLDRAIGSGVETGKLILDPERQQGLIHPNIMGHQAIAQAIASWSRRQVHIEAGPADEFSFRLRDTADLVCDAPEVSVFGPLPPELQMPAKPAPCSQVTVEGSSFRPEGEVTIWLQSHPQALQRVFADSSGAVHTDVIIPADAEPGKHHIVMYGLGKDGRPRATSQLISVGRSSSAFMAVLGMLGALLICAGLIPFAWPRARRIGDQVRRRSHKGGGA